MIKSIKDYLKQWLNLLFLIPSTISVIQTYFHEELKDTWLSFIVSLTKMDILYIFIGIAIIAGLNITFIKNNIIEKLKIKIETLKQNAPSVKLIVNGNFYANIDQGQYINSDVVKGDKSKINKK